MIYVIHLFIAYAFFQGTLQRILSSLPDQLMGCLQVGTSFLLSTFAPNEVNNFFLLRTLLKCINIFIAVISNKITK